ncbi:alpha/beta fold hydrolase [Nocardia wallacei]|uniref:alpha/beta fold hydrolase n=1 Tax=Nocardia wallacei TaxID=480035 RepID=UPI002458D0E8|nr:alpha/beta hydrolase [Nocardia wallacei]
MTSPDFHPATVAADDGARLAVTRVGPLDAAATVVYVHPLLADRGFWAPVTGEVHQRLCGAVAQLTYDQRGHGDSDRPNPREVTSLRRLADDLDAVLAHADGSVVLVAHSTGAQLVYAYAIAHPDRAAALSGLVLLNAAAQYPSLPRYLRTWPPQLIRLRRYRALDVFTAAGEAAVRHRLQHDDHQLALSPGTDPRVAIDILGAHSGFGLSTGVARLLRPIPSIVLAGERDTLVPPQRAVALADALWADYDLLPGGGHHLPHTHCTQVTDTVTALLDHALRVHLEHSSPAITRGPRIEPGRA